MTPSTTPMMAQWHECKAQAKEALLFFRLGDFYEAFYQDAEVMAKQLGLTLTARQGIPMCGVPYHTAETYLDKLVALGFKIAVAEQIGDPEQTKGIVKREITRIVTPGTLINSQLLVDNKNNYFVSLVQIGSTFGLSILDLSTGQFTALELEDLQDVLDELYRLRPAEFLVGKKFRDDHPQFFKELEVSFHFLLNLKEPLDLRFCTDVLTCHFQVHHLDSVGLRGKNASIIASGSLLLYLKEELNMNCDHILTIHIDSLSKYLALDRASIRNLELTETMSEGSEKNTLLDILDHTCTPMGGRLLRNWVKYPLLSVEEIQARQDSIAYYLQELTIAKNLRKNLSKIRDLERLTMKIGTRFATPRDLLSLGTSLASASQVLPEAITLQPLFEKILHALHENPPLRLSDGEVFKDHYHAELNRLRNLSKESTSYLMNYQNSLREQTGIKTLKVGFTRAFGYYIEVSRGQSEKIPDFFQRRQTLVNGERFITEELKQFEHQILSAEERSKNLEAELFEELRIACSKEAPQIHKIAKEIAKMDCLLSLAWVAFEKNLIRPVVDESNTLEIIEGRHPIVEHVVGPASFIANDTILSDSQQMMLITGPNMAGKSTYIRQVALITILAQMGSFVPATRAHIGIVDKVFSRIGASDDLARGQSTFMVEMTETANILKNSTSRSLVLLDEIGRGTSTYDGISIAWAVAEYLLTTQKKQAKTLFATHYWELTKLEQQFSNASNYQIAVQEAPSGIVFLRKIIRGGTDKSYGIHVAKLAGIPSKAIKRAEEMLKELEAKQHKAKKEEQLFLFSPPPFVQELQEIHLDDLTPIEALEKIRNWKKRT